MIHRTVLGAIALVVTVGCGQTIDDTTDLDDASPEATIEDQPALDDQPDVTATSDAIVDDDVPPLVDRPDASADASRDARVDAAADVPRDRPLDAGARDAMADRPDVVARDVPADRAPVLDGGCPAEMALVQGRVCIDRWEAHLEARDMDGGVSAWSPYLNPGTRWVSALSAEGEVPQGYISGSQARAACVNAGKRLCALADWVAGCRGPANLIYPYGNTYVRRRCNEARTPHPVVQFYGTSVGVFTSERMNNPGINQQPDSLAPSGAFSECLSPYGLADMVGNLHEWINDTAGTFKGGFYVDAEINGHGCLYTTTAHNFDYRDYSTGFRCCADPR